MKYRSILLRNRAIWNFIYLIDERAEMTSHVTSCTECRLIGLLTLICRVESDAIDCTGSARPQEAPWASLLVTHHQSRPRICNLDFFDIVSYILVAEGECVYPIL